MSWAEHQRVDEVMSEFLEELYFQGFGGWGGQQPLPLPTSFLAHPHPPITCPATCRAAPRAAQPVTVVVGAGLGRAAMSRRTS